MGRTNKTYLPLWDVGSITVEFFCYGVRHVEHLRVNHTRRSLWWIGDMGDVDIDAYAGSSSVLVSPTGGRTSERPVTAWWPSKGVPVPSPQSSDSELLVCYWTGQQREIRRVQRFSSRSWGASVGKVFFECAGSTLSEGVEGVTGWRRYPVIGTAQVVNGVLAYVPDPHAPLSGPPRSQIDVLADIWRVDSDSIAKALQKTS